MWIWKACSREPESRYLRFFRKTQTTFYHRVEGGRLRLRKRSDSTDSLACFSSMTRDRCTELDLKGSSVGLFNSVEFTSREERSLFSTREPTHSHSLTVEATCTIPGKIWSIKSPSLLAPHCPLQVSPQYTTKLSDLHISHTRTLQEANCYK